MPRLALYNVGEVVLLQGMPKTLAKVLSKTGSSVSVEVSEHYGPKRRYTTTWAPDTLVSLYIPEKTPAAEEPAPSQPQKPQDAPQTQPTGKATPKPPKAEKGVPSAPKAKAEVDVFGVRKGTMAAAVNIFLLSKRKNITVADVLANVQGSKKDNVTSHLRRMVKDNLITNSGKDKELIVSVPKGVK